MSRPPLFFSQHQQGPFSSHFGGTDVLQYAANEPPQSDAHGRIGCVAGGAFGATHEAPLPFRHSSVLAKRPLGRTPTQSADLPAASNNYHPAVAASAFEQRTGAASSERKTDAVAAAHARALQQHQRILRTLEQVSEHRHNSLKVSRASRAADFTMAANAGFGPSDEELAQLQKLSADYVPDVAGPLVSERIPTSAITAEYARADPIYQTKTATLPERYSYYRTCKGDGHCGWRAIAFCYYETLLQIGSKQKFLEEETRIRSLSNLLQAVSLSRDIFEDWEEELLDLLRSIASSPSIEQGDAELLTAFNEGGPWQSIITYLKVLTGAWIRTRRDDYEPFMQGTTVEEYVSRNIEAAQCEIEHLGLNALFDVLLKPAGFALEVMYLDRSAGTDLFPHRFDPVDQTGLPVANPPTIRLLYRPGHYDILYAFADIASFNNLLSPSSTVSAPTNGVNLNGNVNVLLASPTEDAPSTGLHDTPHSHIGFADNFMPIIPGMSGISAPGIGSSQSVWMPPPPGPTGMYPAGSSYDFAAQSVMQRDDPPTHQPIQAQPAPSQSPSSAPPTSQQQRISPQLEQDYKYSQSVSIPASSSYGLAMPAPPTNPTEMFVPAGNMTVIAQHHHHHHPPHNAPAVSPSSAQAAPAVQVGGIDRSGGPFRPSVWELESRWGEAAGGGMIGVSRETGFQTSIFRNSHFNVAHFNNPDFQPEEWTPGSEASPERAVGRRKSSAH